MIIVSNLDCVNQKNQLLSTVEISAGAIIQTIFGLFLSLPQDCFYA